MLTLIRADTQPQRDLSNTALFGAYTFSPRETNASFHFFLLSFSSLRCAKLIPVRSAMTLTLLFLLYRSTAVQQHRLAIKNHY